MCVTAVFGAIYQLAPVTLSTTLWHERYGWWHFWLHTISVPGMVYAFWRWDMGLLGHFGTVLALEIGLFATNVWQTVRRSRHGDVVACSLLLTAGWLACTVLLGLLFAANRFWHFLPLDPVALLRAHAHLGLVGVFVTLLQGVTFRLIPMFTLGDVSDCRPVRLGLWCSQLGLLALVPSLAWNARYATLGAGGIIFVGVAMSAWALLRTLATRRKRPLDPGVRAFRRGMLSLVATAALGLVLAWPGAPSGSTPGGCNGTIYGVLAFGGVLLPTFAGMLCKIVPFLTWMRAYGPKIGRTPTPAAGALARPAWETWAFALQTVALAPLLAGVWLLHRPLVAVGAWLLAAGVALFLANMLGVLSHLWRPAAAPARAPASAST